MTLARFRIAAIVLVVFNLVGTVLTWAFELDKPGTSAAHAVAQGTEFTGPLLFVGLWVVLIALMWTHGRAATVSMWLMTLFAFGFAFGDLTELFKSNVGVSGTKWDLILAADVVSLALGLTVGIMGVSTIIHLRRERAARRVEPAFS